MKNKIDLTTLIGIVLSIGGIGAGYLMEGGKLSALIAVSPICIIFGGTIGVAILTQPLTTLKRIPGMLKNVFTEKDFDYIALINQLCDLTAKARKEGIVALDKVKDNIEDPFVRRGLTYVVDSIEPAAVKEFLENDIGQMMDRHTKNASFFDQAGASAPTMGIIGTVLGLVTILSKLGGADITELGEGIATAFLATFMGVSTANLLYIPFASKLKNKSAKEVLYREIATYGIIAIQSQESPIILRERLLSFLPDNLKVKGKVE